MPRSRLINPGALDRKVTILYRETTRDEVYNAVLSEDWQELAVVWAQVQDYLPSRGERLADGINITSRPARVRMRYRDDVTSAMRLQVDGRTLTIIAGPAELGRREGLEMVAQEISPQGHEP